MSAPGGLHGLQIVQPLGDGAVLAALDASTGTPRLVLVERATRASPVPAARAELLRRGRALKALAHPKVVGIRDAFERDGDVLVVSEYVDGEWLASLMMMQPRPPLEVLLRLVVDVLEGLGALHDLRDDRGQLLGFVHGGIAPDTILVAEEGVARIAHACRLPRPGPNERYVAPELRRGDAPPDPRCDIYAAGGILRDVLADATAEAAWAEPLTEIAWRACSVDPGDRWPSAAAMATTVRRVAATHLATAASVADFVRRKFGAKIRARRAELESAEEAPPPPSTDPISLAPSDMEVVDAPSSPDAATVPAMAVRKEVPVARIALQKRTMPGVAAATATAAAPVARSSGATTQPGLAPPEAPTRPSLQSPPTPPSGMVPAAPPPPSIRPELVADDDGPTEAYRRQLPTFPTFEDEPLPKKRGGLIGVLGAAGMVATFALGWWLGRSTAPTAVTPPAAARPLPATVTLAVVPPPSATLTTASAVGSTSATLAPPRAPAALSAATAAPQSADNETPHPAKTPARTANAPPPARTAAATAPVARPTATVAPKPASTGGYVPSEL